MENSPSFISIDGQRDDLFSMKMINSLALPIVDGRLLPKDLEDLSEILSEFDNKDFHYKNL